MNKLTESFTSLGPSRRRQVHFELCRYALQQWQRYTAAKGKIAYIESITGARQVVDLHLPAAAFKAARHGQDMAGIQQRYREPIAAMQDEDLIFPEPIMFAYYAIYNLFQKYALTKGVDARLIVNQALASTTERQVQSTWLATAVQQAIDGPENGSS